MNQRQSKRITREHIEINSDCDARDGTTIPKIQDDEKYLHDI